MKRYYVVGPFRAEGNVGERINVARAESAGRMLEKAGYTVTVPHSTSVVLDPGNDKGDDYWLAHTLDLCLRCDALVVLPGWEASAGSRTEVARGMAAGMTFHTLRELIGDFEWIGGDDEWQGSHGCASTPRPEPTASSTL